MVLYMFMFILFFFFKQKTAYEMRISDWSSDVCSSDLISAAATPFRAGWRSHRHGPAGPFGGEVGKPDSLYAGGHDPFQPDGLSHRFHDQPCDNTLRRVRAPDRKSAVSGQSVSVRVEFGGRRLPKNKQTHTSSNDSHTQKHYVIQTHA